MSDLPRAPMQPPDTEWVALCPTCDRRQLIDEVVETDFGTFVVKGPERFPLCEGCGVQFEIIEMRLSPAPAP